MRSRRVAVVVSMVMAVAMGVPAHGVAQTPPLLNWGEVIPGFHPGLDTSSSNICTAGRPQCVESALRTLARDFDKQLRSCDHDAVFQLGYLRTTEAYYESSQIPGFYADVPWMHHYDAVFAEYYFSPQRAWDRGRLADVPPAWQQAFAASEGEELSVTGSFLMGMNAHINRDLPFVLDDIGLTAADGTSRKPDHEKVNEFLNHVGDDLTPEMSARFDPDFGSDDPTESVLRGLAIQQVIQEWRERAWNNAWLMTYAPAPIPDLVAQGIEVGSGQLAAVVRQGTAIDDDATTARNAYCTANGRSWAGGDGTYFDGEFEPAYDAPSIDLPNPAEELEALAALGVHVDVDLITGVTVKVARDLLDGVEGLGLLDSVDAVVVDAGPVDGGLIDATTSTVGATTTTLTTSTGSLLRS
jgi:hypothetical protein